MKIELGLQQAEFVQHLLQELNNELKRHKGSSVIDDFMKGIHGLEALVRSEAKAAWEDANRQTSYRIEHLREEISLRKQLDKANKKVEELENEITWLKEELENKRVALMEAESDKRAAERVGIPSPEEEDLRKEVDRLVLRLDKEIKKKIEGMNEDINRVRKKIAEEDKVELHRGIILPAYEDSLKMLEEEREETQKELKKKQDELGALRNCPICIRRMSDESMSSRSSVDSGIGMSSVGSGRKSGTTLSSVPEKDLEDNTESHSGKRT